MFNVHNNNKFKKLKMAVNKFIFLTFAKTLIHFS